MTRAVVTEAEVLRACLDLLRLRDVVHLRLNSGVLRNPQGRPVRFGAAGLPDLVLVIAGRAVFLELKGSAGRLSPAQAAAHATLRAAGAVVLVITDVARLAAALDALAADPDADP